MPMDLLLPRNFGIGGLTMAEKEYVATISVFLSDIGKNVFLTREEAEKALAERNGKE